MPDAERREIPDPGFADDDGRADPALLEAVAAYAADPARLPQVLAVLHRTRVLAPVIALLGTAVTTPEGLVRDTTAEIAVPVLVDALGARALPVFSDLAALARWDPTARPVPVTGPRAAQVALAEGAEGLVLDIAGSSPVTLPGPELRALAEGRGRTPAWEDAELAAAVATVLSGEPAARSAHLDPWPGRDARLTVLIDPGADRGAVADRLAAGMAALDVVRAGVRGVELVVAIS